MKVLTGISSLEIVDNQLVFDDSKNYSKGSSTARNFLVHAMKSDNEFYVFDSGGGSHAKQLPSGYKKVNGEVVLDAKNRPKSINRFAVEIDNKQIGKFVNGVSHKLNPLTLGFGMTFLHEISHKFINFRDFITKNTYGDIFVNLYIL